MDAKYPTLNAEGKAVPRVALEAELTIQFRDLDNPAKVTPEKKKEIMKLLTDALGGTAVAGDKAASLVGLTVYSMEQAELQILSLLLLPLVLVKEN